MQKKKRVATAEIKVDRVNARPYVVIITIILLIITLLFTMMRSNLDLSERHSRLLHATMQVKNQVTTSHLWIEERLAGDQDISKKVILSTVINASVIVERLLQGGALYFDDELVVKHPELRGKLEKVLVELNQFIVISNERLAAVIDVGPGSEFDAAFDSLYHSIMAHSDNVDIILREMVKKQLRQHYQLNCLVVGMLALLMLGSLFLFYRFDKGRRRANADLRQMHDFTDAALNAQTDTLFIFDPVTNEPIRWNRAFSDVTGYSDAEIAGLSAMSAYCSPNEKERCDDFLAGVIKAGEGAIELKLLCKDGRQVMTEYRVSVISGDANTGGHLIAIGRDITERKQIEVELSQHRDHLKDLVQQRTADLSEARDEAVKANSAKSEFLSRMSHELRTPMNAILGFAQLLELDVGGLNETQKSDVREILDAGQHLLLLINDVLDLARIESGKMEVHMGDVDVSEVTRRCLTFITHQAQASNLVLNDQLSDQAYHVHADPTRLKQVLLNLFSNAVKYNRDNGSITLTGEIIDQQRLRISVSDTGKGLSEEDLNKLFIAFERINAEDHIEGTGIGLVITKHLMGLMGGYIGVESCAGEGSTFWIELMLSDGA